MLPRKTYQLHQEDTFSGNSRCWIIHTTEFNDGKGNQRQVMWLNGGNKTNAQRVHLEFDPSSSGGLRIQPRFLTTLAYRSCF